MSQTIGEYLDAHYGDAQQSIQLELDWMESLVTSEFYHCTECGPNHMIQLPDGSWQCGQCD